MPKTTDDQAIDVLRRSHAAMADMAPSAPEWAVVEQQVTPTARPRGRLLLAAGTAVTVGVLVGAFLFSSILDSSRESDSASSVDLPVFIQLSQAVVEVSSINYIGDDADAWGPLKVYEAEVIAVPFQDERFGTTIAPSETLRVIVPADLEEARIDFSTDRASTLLLAYREPSPGDQPPSEWRIWALFDDEAHEFVGPAAIYNEDLRAVLPAATSTDLGEWAAEADAVAAGEPGGEYTLAWTTYVEERLRAARWEDTDPRVRSLDPERMPKDLRSNVEVIPAIIEIPESIVSDATFDEVSVSIRSDFGVVHQAQIQVGTHYAVLWSRPGDSWTVVLLRGDDLDGVRLGSVAVGGVRLGEAMSITLSESALRSAATVGTAEPEPTPGAVVPNALTRSELEQRLAALAAD